jgi:hypothetical protein
VVLFVCIMNLIMRMGQKIYGILGSVDFLGNPVSLVSTLGTGVADFFYEPAMGLVKVNNFFSWIVCTVLILHHVPEPASISRRPCKRN